MVRQTYFLLILTILLLLTVSCSNNSEDAVFNRYLDRITGINRDDIQAIDVHIAKKGTIIKSYFDNDKSYLVLDILNEVKSLNPSTALNNHDDYSINIRNVFQTSNSRYEIKIDVNEDNYDFRINELSVDIDNNNRIAKVKYYNSNERSIELLRELLDF